MSQKLQDKFVEAATIIQDAMPVLARYGARERKPDEEAWSVYSRCMRFFSSLGAYEPTQEKDG